MAEESSAPPPAEVEWNDWRSLVPPELGEWEPSAAVSVVIPAYQAQRELDLVIPVLAEQSYPRSLIQVVIVDDGSSPPIELGHLSDGLEIELIYRERDGTRFGSGAARNLGASNAEGEILVFLDADMIPSPEMIEAHARWHHLVSDAATQGFRHHIEVDGLVPEEVRQAASTGSLHAMLESRDPEGVEWIDKFMARTDNLTLPRLDPFRVFAGGNFALRADTYRAVGGIRELGIRGVEDIELGYRLSNYGVVLIPEPRAMSWHQGKSYFKGDDAAVAKYIRAPVMANYIPVGRFRPTDTQRTFAVPCFSVRLRVKDEPATAIVELVDALLTSYGDLEAKVVLDHGYPDAGFLERAFTAEPRVTLVDPNEDEDSALESPFLVRWPTDAVPGSATFPAILERMTDEPQGALHLTVPGEPPLGATIDVLSTRAAARAGRVTSLNGGDLDATIGQLFGERWVSGIDLGVEAFSEGSWRSQRARAMLADAASAEEVAARRRGFTPLPPARPRAPSVEEDLEQRLALAQRQIDALLRRRALRLATNAGRALRRLDSLGPRGLVRSIRQRDGRGAALSLAGMVAAAAVAAAAALLLWTAASDSEAVLIATVAVIATAAGAGIATLLTSSSGELRRLSVEREQAQSKAIELERSLSETRTALDKLEGRSTTLEGENESLQQALAERDESVRRLQREVAELSQPGVRRWLSSWRRRASR